MRLQYKTQEETIHQGMRNVLSDSFHSKHRKYMNTHRERILSCLRLDLKFQWQRLKNIQKFVVYQTNRNLAKLDYFKKLLTLNALK